MMPESNCFDSVQYKEVFFIRVDIAQLKHKEKVESFFMTKLKTI